MSLINRFASAAPGGKQQATPGQSKTACGGGGDRLVHKRKKSRPRFGV